MLKVQALIDPSRLKQVPFIWTDRNRCTPILSKSCARFDKLYETKRFRGAVNVHCMSFAFRCSSLNNPIENKRNAVIDAVLFEIHYVILTYNLWRITCKVTRDVTKIKKKRKEKEKPRSSQLYSTVILIHLSIRQEGQGNSKTISLNLLPYQLFSRKYASSDYSISQ